MAFVLDAYSRRVVGWSMANSLRTEIVIDALRTWPSGAGSPILGSSTIPITDLSRPQLSSESG